MNEINNKSDFELWIEDIQNESDEDFQKYYKREYLEKTYNGKLPIHLTCLHGNFRVLQRLVNEGYDIEANDNRKWRPLHYICQQGNVEIAQLLIEKGCEIDPRNEADWTPLHYASGYGFSKIVQLLIINNCNIEAVCSVDGWRPIHNACRFGHLENVKILLDNNCEFDVYDKEKRAPIHHACKGGYEEIVNLLLDKECNIEACDINNKRPIHYASAYNHLNIVKKLLRYACLINVKTAENKSPLNLAMETNNRELIKILTEEEIRVDLVNKMATEMKIECSAECNHEFCARSLRLMDFERGKLIGSGAFGNVYRQREFAIKQLKCKAINEIERIYDKKKLINEKKEKLQHKRIVKFYGAISDSFSFFIFMEYIDGGDLDKKIKNSKKLTADEIIHYSWQILEGIEFLHGLKIIHRDIKPLNILLTKENDIKLVDFDFFRSISGSQGGSIVGKTFCGTANFMAPEILEKIPYDCSVDIWSLGATIINMFTGKPPYHDLVDNQVIFKINKFKKLEIPNDLPQELMSLLEETLRSDPNQRPTASELLTREIFRHQQIG